MLRSFAEISGLNMVIDPRVTGTVDVALRDVPWDQALDIILRANGLGYTRRRDDRPDRAGRASSPPKNTAQGASSPRRRPTPGS